MATDQPRCRRPVTHSSGRHLTTKGETPVHSPGKTTLGSSEAWNPQEGSTSSVGTRLQKLTDTERNTSSDTHEDVTHSVHCSSGETPHTVLVTGTEGLKHERSWFQRKVGGCQGSLGTGAQQAGGEDSRGTLPPGKRGDQKARQSPHTCVSHHGPPPRLSCNFRHPKARLQLKLDAQNVRPGAILCFLFPEKQGWLPAPRALTVTSHKPSCVLRMPQGLGCTAL